MMSWFFGYGFTDFRFCASVLPLTVMQSPCSSPWFSSIFMSGWMPPIRISSDIAYLPLGRRSASTGTRLPMRVKSSSSSGTPTVWAMASRCRTTLVEPPSAMVTVIAFSNALRVRICEGRRSAFTSCSTAFAALRQSCSFWADTASCAELLGRLMPSASMAEAIELAVYMPPQLPGPGMAVRSISDSSLSLIVPAARAPTASNTEMMSRRFLPGLIVPP